MFNFDSWHSAASRLVFAALISWAIQLAAGEAASQEISELPLVPALRQADKDWLIAPSPFKARVYRNQENNELILDNGLVRRTIRIAPNAATVGLDNLVNGQAVLRGVKPEARLSVNGKQWDIGGLKGQPNYAFLLPSWIDGLKSDPGALHFKSFKIGKPKERLGWQRLRHAAPNTPWPPRGVSLRLDFQAPESSVELLPLRVSVHYELYDGLPGMCKWLTVENQGDEDLVINSFESEILAVVEEQNWVETRDGVAIPRPQSLHVETDFAFGGFKHQNANRHVVHWRPDPDFKTQVNYKRASPCLLVVSPTYGPQQVVKPGVVFATHRTFELFYDSRERERRGLSLRRFYRTVAPWVTENPLMHHLLTSNPARAKEAIDEAAAVGFEMIILSFGSGFNMDNESDSFLDQWREVADYARKRGIEIGSYSLLSSRRVSDEHMIVSPAGQRPTHNQCPALTSQWGQEYFARLRQFFKKTGFKLLEHDGSYPGDVDVTPRPPLQQGEQDSRWVQWRIISDFYKDCRKRGIYLNVPDYYFLSGSNKCGMGYREVNWSLPREMQVIHTRQNIYDGTWTKTPSMGWMFVPLSEYHGGGAAATIEPLEEHLDHYRRMLDANLALGVQACYRGPRLYDTSRTRELVRERVAWFKKYRDILESDLVHGRRADGRDLDWMLHVNPELENRGMLVVFNPMDAMVEKTLRVDTYYTGLQQTVAVFDEQMDRQRIELEQGRYASIKVQVPAKGMSWYLLRDIRDEQAEQ